MTWPEIHSKKLIKYQYIGRNSMTWPEKGSLNINYSGLYSRIEFNLLTFWFSKYQYQPEFQWLDLFLVKNFKKAQKVSTFLKTQIYWKSPYIWSKKGSKNWKNVKKKVQKTLFFSLFNTKKHVSNKYRERLQDFG